jgi:molybdopterin converting factor subunit 1
MEIVILFFGELAEIAGTKKRIVSSIEDTLSLKEYINKEYPLLLNRKFRIAVNKEVVSANQSLKDGDEIALLPPFAGG